MTTEWLGGGFMIALAAVLWLVYLVPSWFRSRQYLATERNAVRLQQTLRILAETSEMPEEVRVEASARSIAEQERFLKHTVAERQADAVPAVVRTADRLRRSRAITAAVLALSIAVAVLGGMQAVYTGAWIILVGGVIASVVSVAVLAKLAKAGRRLKLPRPAVQIAPEFVDHAEPIESDFGSVDDLEREVETVESSWVPVTVPRPLYLGRTAQTPLGLENTVAGADEESDESQDAMGATGVAGTGTEGLEFETATATASAAERSHQESLLLAAAEAEEALRARLAAQHEAVAELPIAEPAPVEAPAPVPSRFARMGIVDDDTSPHLDLDAVLARRRAG